MANAKQYRIERDEARKNLSIQMQKVNLLEAKVKVLGAQVEGLKQQLQQSGAGNGTQS